MISKREKMIMFLLNRHHNRINALLKVQEDHYHQLQYLLNMVGTLNESMKVIDKKLEEKKENGRNIRKSSTA